MTRLRAVAAIEGTIERAFECEKTANKQVEDRNTKETPRLMRQKL